MPERIPMPSGSQWLQMLGFLHSSAYVLQGDEVALRQMIAGMGRNEVLEMVEAAKLYAEVLDASAGVLRDTADRMNAALEALAAG